MMNAFAHEPAPSGRPLVLSLLLGVSGWIAGFFLLGVVGLLFHPDSAGPAGLCGAVLLAAAWGLFAAARDGEPVFVAQLALALSIAGQCLVLYALTGHSVGFAPIAAAALVLQAVLALVMPNGLHRTLSALFATIAWALTLHFCLLGDDGNWSRATPLQDTASLPTTLVAWLLAWGPLAAALAWAIRREDEWTARGWAPVLRPILTGLVAGLALATLASQPFESIRWFGDRNGGVALWPLLSALGALFALAAAFALGRRALMALCAVAALLHVANFYLALGASLLAKSALMIVIGAVFVAAARTLNSKETA